MIKFKPLLLCVCILYSCSNAVKQPNALVPDPILMEQDSTLTSTFFDEGAWFGVTLSSSPGLAPPLLLSDSNGYMFKSPILVGSISEEGMPVETFKNSFLPGSLMQQATTSKSVITLKSVFIDHQTLLLAYQVQNTSDSQIGYKVEWSFPDSDSQLSDKTKWDLGNAELELMFSSGTLKPNVNENEFDIEPKGEKTLFLTLRHRFKDEPKLSPFDFSESSSHFVENNSRWTDYLKPYQNLSRDKKMLASKCIQTLVNNWRAPAGELKYAGLFPSYDYKWFHGFWSWDSWKHAVALVTFEQELAKDQVRTMYHFQDEFGMIADVVYRDTLIENHNWRDTKPPLSGWAIHEIFNATQDTSFVRELLPKLLRYHSWWYKNRDHNRNGLCEFGSTDGTRVAAGWESGMDNAVRFDDAKMIQVNKSAWSLDQESIDLNAYLYKEKKHIASLLTLLGDKGSMEMFRRDADLLKTKLQTQFHDPESNYFYDFNTSSQSLMKIVGPEAWTALWSGVATEEQADGIVAKIIDPTFFNTPLPFPTLSASHSKFDPRNGYWRGPVWIDQAYFALSGMKNYGFENEFEELKTKLLENVDGLLQKGVPIRENYDPRNGKGLNANHFSWSAALLLMLLRSETS